MILPPEKLNNTMYAHFQETEHNGLLYALRAAHGQGQLLQKHRRILLAR